MGNRPTRAASTGKGIGNNSTNPRRRSLLLNPPANTSAGNEAYITSPRSSESGGEESTQQRNTAIGTAPATAPATGTSDNAIEISDSDENGEETGGTAPGTSNDVIEISDSEDNGEEAERQMSSVAPVPESFPVSPRGEPTQDREEERASPERRETAPATQDLAQRTEAAAPATDWDEDAGEEALEAQNDDIDVSGALNLQGARTAAVYGRIEQNWQREREQGPPLEHRGAPLMTTEEPPLENITAAAAVAAAIDESQVEEAPADQNEDDTPGTRDSLINPPLSTMYDPGLFTGDGNYGADIQGDDGWEIYEGADMPPTEVPDEVPAGDPDGHPDNLQGQPNVFQNSVSEDLPNGLPNVDVNEIFHTNGLARNNGFTGENIPPYTYGRINNHTGYINGDETIHEPNDSGPNHIGSQHPMQDPRQERQQRPENEQHQNPDVMTNHYAPNEEEGTAQATAQPDPSQVENAAAEPRRGSHQFPIDLTGEPQEGLQQEQRDEERQESEVEDRTGLQFPNPHLNPNYPFSPDTNPGDSPETSSATSTINDSDPETHREHELGPEPATEPAPEPEPEPEQEQELEQAEEEERDIPEYQSLPRRQTGKRPRRSRNVQPSSSASRPRAPTKIRRRGRGNLQASGTVPPLRRSARLQALRESRNAQMSATSQPETSTEQQSQGRSGNRHASGAVSRARGSTGPGKRRGSGIARASGAVSRPKQKTRGGRQPQSGSEQQEENNDNQHEGRETTTSLPPRGIKRRSPSESGDEGPSKRRQTQVPTGNLRASGSAPQTEGKTKGGGQSGGQKKKKKASGRARKDDVSYKPEDEVEEDEEYEEGEEMQEPPSAKPRGIKRRSPSESENEGPSKPRQTQAPSGSSRTLGNDSQPRGKKGGCGQASGQKNKKKATGRAKKYDVAYKPGDEVDEDEEEEEMQGPPSALPRGIKRVSLSEPPHERPRKRPQTKAPAGSSQQAPGQKRADPQARSSRKRQKAAVKGNTRKKDAEYVDDQATSDVEDTLNLGGKTRKYPSQPVYLESTDHSLTRQ
ncbi:hypothetical protein BJX61DRAFT_509857 [Aspergillus egyptiacus]|nr:hypothetical protein BJX61DRAFT_509857 [Aspergillus egyptiacus]